VLNYNDHSCLSQPPIAEAILNMGRYMAMMIGAKVPAKNIIMSGSSKAVKALT